MYTKLQMQRYIRFTRMKVGYKVPNLKALPKREGVISCSRSSGFTPDSNVGVTIRYTQFLVYSFIPFVHSIKVRQALPESLVKAQTLTKQEMAYTTEPLRFHEISFSAHQ